MLKLAGSYCFSKGKNNRLSLDYRKKKFNTIIFFSFSLRQKISCFLNVQILQQLLLAENVFSLYIIMIISC